MSQQDLSQKDTQNGPTGSPSQDEPVFIAVGFLRRSHGIKGEIIMDVLTDFPERIRVNRQVFVGEEHEPYRIQTVRAHEPALLVKFKGYDTPEDVARFRNLTVYVRVDQLPKLPEDMYYHHQLLGLTVKDEAGNVFGQLSSILETGANDVYVVRKEDGSELLFPAIEGVVLDVNLERKEMIVRPQEWA
jgi:16S rRNA processing protein RimM